MISYAWYLSRNDYHIFIYQCNMVKIFLGTFTSVKRFFNKIFFPVFQTWCCLSGQFGRLGGRPNLGPVDRAVDRRAQTCARLQHSGPVDRTVDRYRELCSLFVSVDRAVDRRFQRVKLWPLDGRPAGRPLGQSGWHVSLTASFLFGLYKPQLFGILAKVFTRENTLFSEFKNKFF